MKRQKITNFQGWAVGTDKYEFYEGYTATNDEFCRDLDECQADKEYNFCDGNATCTNTLGSYECDCLDGFEGDGLKCLDIQECDDPRYSLFN